ncbi:DEKNAAC104618 [Brettanomyces naardenensis]|uniref:DEKNAAC104618 n=1 Tax=Brettanomyces naardenensis TaxID=13370 RepID=A0A448YR36_BRENA|nr:DEKNAAC104618 [Brettanomyces naardenensis]
MSGDTDFQASDRSTGEVKSRFRVTASSEKNVDGSVIVQSSEVSSDMDDLELDLDKIEQAHRLDNIQISFAIFYDFFVVTAARYLQLSFFEKFFVLQYRNPDGVVSYTRGIDDTYLVLTIIVNMMLVRSLTMRLVFYPLAQLAGIHNFKAIQRFKEQSWSLVYYSTSWLFGFYLFWNSNYFLNLDRVFEGWPHNHLSHSFKLYYLIQTGCWLQQIIVLNIEEKRKDYLQMFSHHIITSILCIGSYYTYFTQVGHVILLLMDIVDVFLALAKVLKYLGFNRICDFMFLVFMASWVVLRHGVYNYVFWYIATKSENIMQHDCPRFPPGSTEICYSPYLITGFLVLLAGLQIITIVWLYMIIKVALRVVKGDSAEDVRSDGEE